MSKRNWFVESLKLTVFAGVVLASGCEKKKAEDKGAPAPGVQTASKDDKGAMPGVTATEIKIGQTMPYSGPAAADGVIGKTEQGFIKMINDKGAVNGRK